MNSDLRPDPLDRSSKVYIAGHRGMVGSAIWRRFENDGFTNLVGLPSWDLDLRDRTRVFEFFHSERPAIVIDAAAKVGGIHANDTYPADFLTDNLQVQVNVMEAANEVGVDRLLFLGSSCIYPKHAPQPIHESSLLTGPLEPTNEAYAIAKIAGLMQVQATRKQYGRRWISAMPTNLYGPGDNFHPQNSHVLPSLIRRFVEAKITGAETVSVWGSGTPRREFLFVDDLADAALFLLDNYNAREIVNVGVGEDIQIKDLALLVARTVGYEGAVIQDSTKPDGTPRKLLDVSRLADLGWQATTSLESGVQATTDWYKANLAVARGS